MENEGEFIERRLDEIFEEKPEKPEPQKIRHAVCARCGSAFETTRPSAKLCRDCLSASRRANAQKGGWAKSRAEPVQAPEAEHLISPAAEASGQLPLKGKPLETSAAPQEEAVPEPVPVPEPAPMPEREPEYLTVRKLMELLTHVPDPERVPVLLEERTFADSVELRSLWRVGGETEAVVIIRE